MVRDNLYDRRTKVVNELQLISEACISLAFAILEQRGDEKFLELAEQQTDRLVKVFQEDNELTDYLMQKVVDDMFLGVPALTSATGEEEAVA